ncbi:MAG: hypothetical protein KDJ29_03195 [Hyphomicrobiales bacterium]|nr:hypothetical protein [Hyphomicrobiales bacterium]
MAKRHFFTAIAALLLFVAADAYFDAAYYETVAINALFYEGHMASDTIHAWVQTNMIGF